MSAPDATPFAAVGITGKPDDVAVGETVRRLTRMLRERGCRVILDSDSTAAFAEDGAEAMPRTALGEEADLVIAVGGDGTLLNTARSLIAYDVPLMGINRGRIGFLTDVSPDHLEEVEAVLAGRYVTDERMLLRAEVRFDGRLVTEGAALNDVVLHRWQSARMIEFRTYVDGELLSHLRSDGLIVSTPTGSTAYAMASGGPIIHPALRAIILVPICPHTLSNRPVVIDADRQVEIQVEGAGAELARVSCDSQDDLGLVDGGEIRVRRHPHAVRLIHPTSHRYFEILRAKLGWGDNELD